MLEIRIGPGAVGETNTQPIGHPVKEGKEREAAWMKAVAFDRNVN